MNQREADALFLEAREGILLAGHGLTDTLHAVLDKGAAFRFQAKGFSMAPFIKDNDMLTISPLNTSLVGLGKIVAFLHPDNGKLVIHRVIGRSKRGYFLKGDNIFGIDGLVGRENILGTVSLVQRNGRPLILGLGWERVIIAFFSRIKLFPMILWSWRWSKRLWQQKG